MPIKKYDLVIKTGSYTNKEGATKGRYKNVGSLMENDDGGKFLLIDPTFNFAAIRRDENRDMVIVSLYEPQPKTEGTPQVDKPEDVNWQN